MIANFNDLRILNSEIKDCLGTKQVQTWTEYCRPDHRLEGCTEEAYRMLFEELEDFKGEDRKC